MLIAVRKRRHDETPEEAGASGNLGAQGEVLLLAPKLARPASTAGSASYQQQAELTSGNSVKDLATRLRCRHISMLTPAGLLCPWRAFSSISEAGSRPEGRRGCADTELKKRRRRRRQRKQGRPAGSARPRRQAGQTNEEGARGKRAGRAEALPLRKGPRDCAGCCRRGAQGGSSSQGRARGCNQAGCKAGRAD